MALADTGEGGYSRAVVHPKRPRALATFVLTVTLVLLVCPHVSAGPATDQLRDFFVAVNAVLADGRTTPEWRCEGTGGYAMLVLRP
jgi:hypothetical protein